MNRLKLTRKLLRGEKLNFLQGVSLGVKYFSLPNPIYPIKYIVRGDMRRSDLVRLYIQPVQSLKESLISKKEGCIHNGLSHEDKMYKIASRKRVKTVDSKGIFNVYNVAGRKFETCLVIERAPGLTQAEQDSSLIRRLKKDAIKDAERKGFLVKDTNRGNVIFDKKTSKIYLIDLEQWKYNKAEVQN